MGMPISGHPGQDYPILAGVVLSSNVRRNLLTRGSEQGAGRTGGSALRLIRIHDPRLSIGRMFTSESPSGIGYFESRHESSLRAS